MYSEEDLLPLSALADLLFCERRAALHQLECMWEDSTYTLEGEHLHEKVHEAGHETRPGVRIARGVLLRSLRLGLSGKSDVIEFLPVAANGAQLPGLKGMWQPYPVEYKRGKLPRHEEHYWHVQLCAQALCLEEMLSVQVPSGALFFGASCRRVDVEFGMQLRTETEAAAARLHALISSRVTPTAVREPKCEHCSMLGICIPGAMSGRSARSYLDEALHSAATPDCSAGVSPATSGDSMR
jgi:CRISPR-associated exonuclease Cas4